MTPARRPYDTLKRALDVAAASTALVLLLPVLVLTALAVFLRLGRPVLFHQVRAGRGGQPFRLVKFRSMAPAIDGVDDDARRLDGFGRALRASSLDELPSLVNVLRGDLSLVGPRPLLLEYLPRYTPHESRRHEVRPGVTGLAQVSGRNALDWSERLALDVEYVDRRSLGLDLSILARTIGVVLRRDGISAPGSATMPPLRADLDGDS